MTVKNNQFDSLMLGVCDELFEWDDTCDKT